MPKAEKARISSCGPQNHPLPKLTFNSKIKPDYFTQITQWLVRETELSNGALRLYLDLLLWCGPDTQAWPSQTTLANDLGIKKRQVQNHLNELKEYGLIDWDWREENGHPTNSYHVFKAPLKGPAKAIRIETSTAAQISSNPEEKQPQQDKRAQKITPGGAQKITPGGAQKITPNLHGVELDSFKQQHTERTPDDEIIGLLKQEGITDKVAKGLEQIISLNGRNRDYVLDIIASSKEPNIRQPVGFIVTMIKGNQKPTRSYQAKPKDFLSTTRQEAEAKAKMEKFLKIPGVITSTD